MTSRHYIYVSEIGASTSIGTLGWSFITVAGEDRIVGHRPFLNGRYSAYLTIKPVRRFYGTFQADVRLLNDHSIDDLDDEKFTSAVTINRSLKQCLDSIGRLSGIFSPMISSGVPAAQNCCGRSSVQKLENQDEQSILSVVSSAERATTCF
jgi:hypothetical protein